tara:strand:+ start:24677 stop:25810 length:1134 start_codon:yes stop_codon:yes gene_type:complete
MKNAVFYIALFFTTAVNAQSVVDVSILSRDAELLSTDANWQTISTDGVCSSGTPFQFYSRTLSTADSLLIFFNGGGACWTGEACDLSSEPFVHSPFADMPENNPANDQGIFSFDNPENPFADYNMLFIPYCTGDVFIGGGEHNYSYNNTEGQHIQLTTHHSGYQNSIDTLDWIYEQFTSPERIVVAGSSAGAIGSSFYAGFVAEHYPDIPVTLIADGAGAYASPSLPLVYKAWNTESILPAWPEYKGKNNDNLSFEDFYIASEHHNSNLTMAQYNAAEDEVQEMFTELLGDDPKDFDLTQRLLNNYQKIESEVDTFYSYTAGGQVHTILRSDNFYDYQVEGVRFVDWVKAIIEGREVKDISCVNEAEGCQQAPPSSR